MTIDYVALKAEIQNDPTARGYAGKEDNAVAALLNEIQAGITIRRDNIGPDEILQAIDIRDFNATNATPPACSWFESLTQLRQIRLLNDDGSNTKARLNLNRMLDDTNGSQTRFTAIQNRAGSRAEVLFGRNTIITDADVAVARHS
ncbi:MAG TPA: hypothetical protein VI653_14880 [Steroidobacteraceae bacterium]